MNENILEISGLTKTYTSSHLFKKTRFQALRGIDLDVRKNEIFALIGLNGSGKTTTIKTLLGLIRPDSGKFNILGSPGISGDVRKKLGYLPEIPYFQGEFTPVEMLRFWGSLSGITRDTIEKRIEYALEQTSLSHAAGKKLKGFSRGMLQRLGLAQALLSEPELFILDEPMGGLDPRGIINIRSFMLKLKGSGKTVFFSSHIISEVEKVADRVGMLHGGKIIKITKPHPGLEDDFLETVSGTV